MKVIIPTNHDKIERIYAFDPGGTTGYCVISIDRARVRILIEEIGEFTTWSRLRELMVWKLNKEKEAVVYEGFRVRTLDANLIPVEVIGVLRYLCCENKIMHFEQMPAERVITEKWFPALVSDFPSHYGSAVRHGIFFCTKHLLKGKLPTLVYNLKELKNAYVKS